jgi:hypothetical protein
MVPSAREKGRLLIVPSTPALQRQHDRSRCMLHCLSLFPPRVNIAIVTGFFSNKVKEKGHRTNE